MIMFLHKPRLVLVVLLVLLVHASDVAASDPPECKSQEGALRFQYKCTGSQEDLCIKGRHLRVPESNCDLLPVDEDKICIPCEGGTFIESYNSCDFCETYKECGPHEMADPDRPPSANKDRECIPRPSPSVIPTQCPQCICNQTATCPPIPDRSTEARSSQETKLPEYWTAARPGLTSSTAQPTQEASSSAEARVTEDLKDDRDRWKQIAIGLSVLCVLLFFILTVILIILLIRCWRKMRARNCPQNAKDLPMEPQNGVKNTNLDVAFPHQENTDNCCRRRSADVSTNFEDETQGSQNSSSVPDEGNPIGNNGTRMSNTSDLPSMQQTGNRRSLTRNCRQNANGQGQDQQMECPNGDLNTKLIVDLPQQQNGDNCCRRCSVDALPDEPGDMVPTPDTLGESPHRNRVKKQYDVTGNTPSAQPLLYISMTASSQTDTMPTNEQQQTLSSVPDGGNPTGNNGTLMSNTSDQPSMQQTGYYGKSLSANDKAEGDCSRVILCNEHHVDYVKDNVNSGTEKDLFAKLGISNNDVTDRMTDHRNDGIREQTRCVLIECFLQNSEDTSFNKLLRALDDSGNVNVSRDFKEKFKVG